MYDADVHLVHLSYELWLCLFEGIRERGLDLWEHKGPHARMSPMGFVILCLFGQTTSSDLIADPTLVLGILSGLSSLLHAVAKNNLPNLILFFVCSNQIKHNNPMVYIIC